MGIFGILIGVIIFILPVVIGLWVGVSGLRGNGLNHANRCMTIGLTVITCLPVIIGVTAFASSWSRSWDTTSLGIMGLLTLLGAVLFAIGFALHGQSVRKIHQRASELELLSLAQATELERLRNR